MKWLRKDVFSRKDQEFQHKNGSTTHVSRREEMKQRKIRKKGLIK